MRSLLAVLALLPLLVLIACRGDDAREPSTSRAGAGGGTTGSGGSGGGATGAGGSLILAGTVVTPDTSFVGQVLIDGERIGCVAPGAECEQMHGGTVIETGGIIAPGLIDTHNHILFDIFDDDDWRPNLPASCSVPSDCDASPYCNGDCGCVGGTCKYLDHTQWPDEDEYALMLDYKQCLEDASQGKPVWCPLEYDGDGDLKCEMDKWGELKGLVAGTTSIVGLPGNSSGCFGSLARSIDVAQNDLGDDKIQTSALFPPSSSSADGVCQNFTDGDTEAYLIHVGEGVNQNALDEFAELFSVSTAPGCLYAPQTTITHGTAFGPPEFGQMAAAGMKLTWSPASNVSLYGTTTDIPAAIAAGLTISLAPDWSMGGSPNLLEELRFADAWDDAHFGDVLSAEDLVAMVTTNAAAVLALSDTIGRLAPGYMADLVVFAGDSADPYQAIVDATPASVSLVMVGGVVLYGDPEYEDLAPASPGCEALDVCGAGKFVCVAEDTSEHKLDQTFADIEGALQTALVDLDGIATLPPSACNPACAAGEACFERTVVPQVPANNCPSACGAGEACFRTAMSGNNQYSCLSIHACYPVKSRPMAPLAPLVTCP